MVVLSQQLIGIGAILGTLSVVGEVDSWGLPTGVVIYIIGIIIGQSFRH